MASRGSLDALIDRIGERRLTWALLAAGAAMRIAFLLVTHGLAPLTRHESARVAVSLATRGEFADAFGPGTGLTAHVGWAVVMIPAAIYRLLGAESWPAETLLALIMIAVVLGSFLVCVACLRELGVPRPARLSALAFLCLVPVQVSLEAKELRVWEAGYASLALAAFLLAALRLDRREGPLPLLPLIGLAVGVAAIEVLSPAPGLAAAAVLGLLMLRRVRWTKWPAIAAATLLAYVALTLPWSLRNQRVFGEGVSSRSSLGMAMAISNYEGVLDAPSAQQSYARRFVEVSPNRAPGLARMRAAGGEAAYGSQLKAEATAWIRAHPGEAARLWSRNLRDFYLPPAWLWDRFSARRHIDEIVSSALLGAVSLAGLITIGAMLARRRWRYLYPAAAVLVACAPYVICYPLLRYRYPISSILAAIGVAGIVLLIARLARARDGRAAPA